MTDHLQRRDDTMSTHLRFRGIVGGLALALCLAGCNEAIPQPAADAAAPLQSQEPQPNTGQPAIRAQLFPADARTIQADATPGVTYLVQVNAYKITLPVGAVSRNDDFWKRVNERAVDVPTYELLY